MFRLIQVTQKFPRPQLPDISAAVHTDMDRVFGEVSLKGKKVALGLSSRGIANYAAIVKAVVDWFHARDATPYGIPAMGSHGGASAEGQSKVLRDCGITPFSMGMSMYGDMTTTQVGSYISPSGEVPVYVAYLAMKGDYIFPINRIKPHTQIFGCPFGSGCLKMLAIGFGKLDGPSGYHGCVKAGFTLGDSVKAAGQVVLENCSILGGLGIVENAYHETAAVGAISRPYFMEDESRLYQEACRLMPALPFQKIGALVIGRIGKKISGSGMDPNITGKFWFNESPRPGYPEVRHIAVMDRQGDNYLGIGFADSCNRRAFEGVDPQETVINAQTGGRPELAMPPTLTAANDRELFEIAVKAAGKQLPLVFIRDTLSLDELYVSEHGKRAFFPNAQPSFGEAREVEFDSHGNITWPVFENG